MIAENHRQYAAAKINLRTSSKERMVNTMGMTMTQKILAAHAGLDSVQAGQLILASLDLVLGNDITSLSRNSTSLVKTEFSTKTR